jgi:uncharacterized membrane protein
MLQFLPRRSRLLSCVLDKLPSKGGLVLLFLILIRMQVGVASNVYKFCSSRLLMNACFCRNYKDRVNKMATEIIELKYLTIHAVIITVCHVHCNQYLCFSP